MGIEKSEEASASFDDASGKWPKQSDFRGVWGS